MLIYFFDLVFLTIGRALDASRLLVLTVPKNFFFPLIIAPKNPLKLWAGLERFRNHVASWHYGWAEANTVVYVLSQPYMMDRHTLPPAGGCSSVKENSSCKKHGLCNFKKKKSFKFFNTRVALTLTSISEYHVMSSI